MATRLLLTGFLALTLGACESFDDAFGGGDDGYGGTAFESQGYADEDGFASSDGLGDDCYMRRRGGDDSAVNSLVCQ
ncbi:hypothetical protein [Azospirillum sp. ST 5-10]|uniref:hypothetical protein n=1 Tax=unclassified Azospirillum TaxID=2630922 RepID=UPI003F4A40C5